MGPSLYSFKGAVYDRAADVDVKVKADAQRAAMIIRKQNFYTEKTVYPWVTKEDLGLGALSGVRREIRSARENHPWLSLDDEEMLRASRLWSRDPATGECGFNLAAIMLIGKQETILDVAPVYRTDVILRRADTDRYDDRFVCKSNLVEAYGEISSFCKKWMPDVFALDEEGNRISVRDVIVRELVVNSLIHREYTSPHIARIVIDADGIHIHNASRALYAGSVTPPAIWIQLPRTRQLPISSLRWVVPKSLEVAFGICTSSLSFIRGGFPRWRMAIFSRRLFPCLFRWPMRFPKRLQRIREARAPKKSRLWLTIY